MKEYGIRMVALVLLVVLLTFLLRPVGRWLDEQVLTALSTVHSGEGGTFLYSFAEGITVLGGSTAFMILTVIFTVFFVWKRQWILFLFMFVYFVGGVVINSILKQIIARDRPGGLERSIDYIGESLNLLSYSFPSGHSFRAIMLSLFLIYVISTVTSWSRRKIVFSSIMLITIALTVAGSRVVLGVHFPTDVIAACLYAAAWFYIVDQSFRVFYVNR